MKRIAECELVARKKILAAECFKTILEIAEGFGIIGQNMPSRPPLTLNIRNIASASCVAYLSNLPPNFLIGSRLDTGVTTGTPQIEFIENFIDHCKVDRRLIESFSKETYPSDYSLSRYIVRNLDKLWPEMTIRLWHDDVQRDSVKKLETELASHFEQRAIIRANDQLAEAMDTEAGQTVRPLIEKEVQRQLQKRANKTKSSARKKSSGDPKSQRSMPEKSGSTKPKKSNAPSKEKNRKQKKKSTKISNDDTNSAAASSITSKSDTHGNTRQSTSPPKSILRSTPNTKVSFESKKKHSPRRKTKTKRQRDDSPDGSSSGEGSKQRRGK
jgi:hypothetical protein